MSHEPFDLATIGETLVLFSPPAGERLETASRVDVHIAGAESNVATHLAEMGFRAAWLSRVGDDPFGRIVLRELAAVGVDVSGVTIVPRDRTAVFFKDPAPDGTTVHYYRESSAASALSAEALDAPALRGARVVHLSGVTAALSDTARELVVDAMTAPATSAGLTTFDVNYRPALWDVEHAAPILRSIADRADVVFVGLDEARTLWGCETAEDEREALACATLVVKDAERGAYSFGASGRVEVPSLKVDVVEPVGAGDAFAAGWIAGYLRGGDERLRLRLGHLVAATVLRVTGDHGALAPWHRLLARGRLTDAEWAALRTDDDE